MLSLKRQYDKQYLDSQSFLFLCFHSTETEFRWPFYRQSQHKVQFDNDRNEMDHDMSLHNHEDQQGKVQYIFDDEDGFL